MGAAVGKTTARVNSPDVVEVFLTREKSDACEAAFKSISKASGVWSTYRGAIYKAVVRAESVKACRK